MRNPFRQWRELLAEDARIAERASQRIAWDRFAAGHQDPEIGDPGPEAGPPCLAGSAEPEPEAEP